MRRQYRIGGSITGAALLLTLIALPASGQFSRAEVLKKSSIVFIGTVSQVGEASFAGVPVSPRTVVVRVDVVLEKPSAVSLVQGDEVTVEVKDPSLFREGVQATFYANGWIFGKGLAVREVGHEISTVKLQAEAVSEKGEELSQTRKELSDAELRARIEAADVVIVGRVVEVHPGTMAAVAKVGPMPITEHAPNWQEAVIRVESAIKGAQANQEIVVRFPGSLDVAWHGVPKFKKGQEGTFVLQKDRVSGTPKAMLAGAQVDAYTALNPLNVLSKEEAQRVRALAK